MRSRRPLRHLVTALVAGAAALMAAPLLPTPVGAQEGADAHIRLAHFSPDTPEMDVYVTGADGTETRVLEGLGYGEVSDYAALPAGSYTFLLRPMGAPADSTPAVTASADLVAGAGYTFAAMGPNAELQKALLDDDLAPPPAGQAKVRLIQASSTAGEVDVTTVDGPALAEDRAFATVTGYANIEAGEWTVNVSAADGTQLERRVALDAGTVNTLVVLENAQGEVELTQVVDATGTDVAAEGPLGARQATPLGGIDTGAGALADRIVGTPPSTGSGFSLALAGGGVALLGAVVVLFGLMRRQA
jgi:hypothetical protein